MLRRLRGEGVACTQAPGIRKGKSGEPELAFHPVSLSLPPGIQQGSWDWTVLGPGRNPGTWQGSWDWTGILGPAGILGPGRDPGTGQGSVSGWGLEKGGAGTSSSMFSLLLRNPKDDRWVPRVVLVVYAAASL